MSRKHFLKNSVILHFISLLLVFMIIPFTVLLISTSQKVREIEHERADEYLSGNLNIISITADHVLKGLEAHHTDMLLNTPFVRAIERLEAYEKRDEYTDYLSVRTIKDVLVETSVRDNNIYSTYLYCLDARRMFISSINWDPAFNNCDMTDTAWYIAYERRLIHQPWCLTTALEDGETQILSHYRVIQNYRQPLKGLLSINIKTDVLTNMLNDIDLGDGGACFILDASGNVLYDKNEGFGEMITYAASQVPLDKDSGSLDIEYEDSTIFLSFLKSEYSGFTYVAFAPLSQIQSATSRVTSLTVWYAVESVLLILLSIILVYVYFYKPIRLLANGMQRVQTGDFKARMPVKRNDEIGLINRKFNEMTINIESLIEKNYISELAKRDIQLKLIQNQINEHFLYNTLDSIHWLAKQHGVPKLSKLISALANFYRLSLSYGKDQISVKNVFKLITYYLYIQKIRLGDALTYETQFDDSLLNLRISKYLFIPLVENAIVHGIHGCENGHINVSLLRTNQNARFTVSDNGNGITPSRLRKIRQSLHSDNLDAEDSFALRNINLQLEMDYGVKEGIHIETSVGKGTTVWFDIPIDKEA